MSISREFIFVLCIASLFGSCKQSEENLIPTSNTLESLSKRTLSNDFKTYWYGGKAEITSYKLQQERYGELRNGTAVNIYVSEDFLPEIQVKADRYAETNIPVLKLNQTKKYITGIYPYSVMTSTFSPVNTSQHALKVSHSMQEWCGHVYAQLNNRKDFEITLHSYFEGEADEHFNLSKTWLENEIWTLIRINPEELPTGDVSMIPSFEYSRMSHQKLSVQNAYAKLMQGDSISSYTLTYPDLKRELVIYFDSSFPYGIERWEETHANGLKSIAEKLKRIQTAYWTENGTQYEFMRDSLLLQ